MVPLVSQDLLDLPDPQESLVLQVLLDQPVEPDLQDQLVLQDPQVLVDFKDQQESKAQWDPLESEESLDPKELRD